MNEFKNVIYKRIVISSYVIIWVVFACISVHMNWQMTVVYFQICPSSADPMDDGSGSCLTCCDDDYCDNVGCSETGINSCCDIWYTPLICNTLTREHTTNSVRWFYTKHMYRLKQVSYTYHRVCSCKRTEKSRAIARWYFAWMIHRVVEKNLFKLIENKYICRSTWYMRLRLNSLF